MLIFVGVFIIVVATLMYWRKEKLEGIQELIRKIRYVQSKYKNREVVGQPVELEEVDQAYSEVMQPQDKPKKMEKEL